MPSRWMNEAVVRAALRVRRHDSTTSRARGVALTCVLVSALSASGAARANPADTFGFGSRSVAMGGAVTGKVTDYSANYYNPSGLAFSDSTQLSIGLVGMSSSLEIGDRTSEHGFTSWQAGLIVPGEVLDTPIAFGVAAQVAGRRLSRVLTYTEDDERWFLYENRPEQMFLTANLAIRLLDNLSFGAGIAFLTSTDGELAITGDVVQPVAGISEYDSQLEHELQADLSASRYPLLGLTWEARDDLDLGLTYRGEGSVHLDVDATINGTVLWGPIEIPIEYALLSKTIQSFVPRQWTLGARYSPIESLDLHAAMRWVEWSAYQSPVSASRADLEVSPPEGFIVETPELPEPTSQQRARLTSRLVPHIGLEYRLPTLSGFATWSGRAGYVYERTPLASDSVPVLVDSDRHVISVGVGVDLGPLTDDADTVLELDAHFQRGFLTEQELGAAEDRATAGGDFAAGGAVIGLRM